MVVQHCGLDHNDPMDTIDSYHKSANAAAYELVNPGGGGAAVVVCDHASPHVPPEYDQLGMAPSSFERHIAYDIGAAEVSRHLAEMLDCPAVLASYSRLLIDLNRGRHDPTLVMKLSDGDIIPRNRLVDPYQDRDEFEHRIRHFYEPYHQAVSDIVECKLAEPLLPAVYSIHSFTPAWKGQKRDWEIGVLWDKDDRLVTPLIERLEGAGYCVGNNQPYVGYIHGDCMSQHGTARGLPHVLIEVRQDLIAAPDGQKRWATILADVLKDIAQSVGPYEIEHFGSRNEPVFGSV